MTARKPLPFALRNGPFAVTDARARDVAASRLRASDLAAPFHGTRMSIDAPPELSLLCRALAARMPRGAFCFSHATAAMLWGMPLPHRLQAGPLHVMVPWPKRAPRVAGVVGHAVRSTPRIHVFTGLPLLPPADTWCQLSTLLSLDELVEAGDRLRDRQRQLCTSEAIAAAVDRYGARRGARNLRDAVGLIRERVESPRETRVRLLLVRAGLPEPAVNEEIFDVTGRLIAIGDLVYRRYKVVVEYEGEHHRRDSVQFARDVDRYNDLAEDGWTPIRVTKEMASTDIVGRTRRALIAAGWRP